MLGRTLANNIRVTWLRKKCICLQCRRSGFDPWVRKIFWRRK